MTREEERLGLMTGMRKAGATFRDIAEAFGFSKQRAQQILADAGIVVQRPPRLDECEAEVMRMFHDEATASEIAEAFGVCYTTLRRWFARRGIRLPNRKLQKKKWIGKKFNRLTVRDVWVDPQRNETRVLCDCTCGGTIDADSSNVRCGFTKSCGCLRTEYYERGKRA